MELQLCVCVCMHACVYPYVTMWNNILQFNGTKYKKIVLFIIINTSDRIIFNYIKCGPISFSVKELLLDIFPTSNKITHIIKMEKNKIK